MELDFVSADIRDVRMKRKTTFPTRGNLFPKLPRMKANFAAVLTKYFHESPPPNCIGKGWTVELHTGETAPWYDIPDGQIWVRCQSPSPFLRRWACMDLRIWAVRLVQEEDPEFVSFVQKWEGELYRTNLERGLRSTLKGPADFGQADVMMKALSVKAMRNLAQAHAGSDEFLRSLNGLTPEERVAALRDYVDKNALDEYPEKRDIDPVFRVLMGQHLVRKEVHDYLPGINMDRIARFLDVKPFVAQQIVDKMFAEDPRKVKELLLDADPMWSHATRWAQYDIPFHWLFAFKSIPWPVGVQPPDFVFAAARQENVTPYAFETDNYQTGTASPFYKKYEGYVKECRLAVPMTSEERTADRLFQSFLLHKKMPTV